MLSETKCVLLLFCMLWCQLMSSPVFFSSSKGSVITSSIWRLWMEKVRVYQAFGPSVVNSLVKVVSSLPTLLETEWGVNWVDSLIEDTPLIMPRRVCAHDDRISFFRTQKKINIKNPWNEFRIVNTIWNVGAAFIMVSAPKIQVRPKRTKTLVIFSISWIESVFFFWLIERLTVCFIITAITTMKMTALKASIRRIGPKNAAKNTVTLLMKQLRRERKLQWRRMHTVD